MTTLLGLNPYERTALINAVAPGANDVDDLFARAAWSSIAEPGDRLAGVLVASLGAAPALGALLGRVTADDLERMLREAEVDEGLAGELGTALERWLPRLNDTLITSSLAQAARHGVHLLTPSMTEWPIGLDDLGAHAPIALWVRGSLSAMQALRHSIALVGARAATGYGEHVTMESSAGLVDRGYAIVSGAAYGIDGMAHRAALASRGTTVAFLAGGVDRFYPSGHDALLNRIVETGAVASEVPCGSLPNRWRFLQRNRCIAASSRATVVLEAGWRSGSLNTAGHAVSIGRPLGAVPGPVTSAASAGCHRLMREYTATVVTNADEMAELAPLEGPDPTTEEALLLEALSPRVPRSALEVAQRAGLSQHTAQALLGALELEGRVIERGERGWVRR